MEKKSKLVHSVLYFVVTIIFIVMIVLSIIFVSYYNNAYQKQLYSERLNYVSTMSEQIESTIDVKIDVMWERTSSAYYLINNHSNLNVNEEIAETITKFENVLLLNHGELLYIDSNNNYYSSFSNDANKWNEDELFYITSGEEKNIFIRKINLNQSQMVLIYKLPMAVTSNDNIEITHTAIVLNMDFFKDSFRSNAYGNENASFILNNQGDVLYSDIIVGRSSINANVIDYLSNPDEVTFLNGTSSNDLKKAIDNNESYVSEISHIVDGMNTYSFVSLNPMCYGNWKLIFIINSEYVSNDIDKIAYSSPRKTLHLFIAFSAIITFFILFMFLVISNQRAYKKIMMNSLEIETTNEELKRVTNEAIAANNSKTTFLSKMAHDIRTPINGIKGMTDIAISSMDDKEKVRDCLEKINESSNHLTLLVNEILEMGKLESGKIELDNKAFNIKNLCEYCYMLIEGTLTERKLKLTKNIKNIEHVNVIGSELHIRQIIINILSNAVKYTLDGGEIVFSIKEIKHDGDKCIYQIEVKDTGIGMSEEFQKNIFEPFAQEKAGARTNYVGSGLGMTITKHLVDEMGGNISFVSKVNKGTCFTINLPLQICKDNIVIKNEYQNISLKGLKILAVEDNEINMEIICFILNHAEAIVDKAYNGQEAIDKLNENEYDVILMDVLMPIMDGLEATKAIRNSQKKYKDIPIIAMSANAFAEDIQKSKDAGMNDHLSKPLDRNTVIETINKYVKSND